MPAETVTLVTGAGGEPGRWPYAAAKAAAVNLVRSAAIDFASAGIQVNAVCPGPIETGMTQRILRHRRRAARRRRSNRRERTGVATVGSGR